MHFNDKEMKLLQAQVQHKSVARPCAQETNTWIRILLLTLACYMTSYASVSSLITGDNTHTIHTTVLLTKCVFYAKS